MIFQFTNDQSNSEAKSRLDKIFGLLNDLGNAKQHMANRDYMPAIEIFNQILEVGEYETRSFVYNSNQYDLIF